MKFQRWKDKTKIFYKRKILPANLQIREDLTPKQIHDTAKLEAYAKLVCFQFLKICFYESFIWHQISGVTKIRQPHSKYPMPSNRADEKITIRLIKYAKENSSTGSILTVLVTFLL